MRELDVQAAVVTSAANRNGEAMAQRLSSTGARGAMRILTMGAVVTGKFTSENISFQCGWAIRMQTQ